MGSEMCIRDRCYLRQRIDRRHRRPRQIHVLRRHRLQRRRELRRLLARRRRVQSKQIRLVERRLRRQWRRELRRLFADRPRVQYASRRAARPAEAARQISEARPTRIITTSLRQPSASTRLAILRPPPAAAEPSFWRRSRWVRSAKFDAFIEHHMLFRFPDPPARPSVARTARRSRFGFVFDRSLSELEGNQQTDLSSPGKAGDLPRGAANGLYVRHIRKAASFQQVSAWGRPM